MIEALFANLGLGAVASLLIIILCVVARIAFMMGRFLRSYEGNLRRVQRLEERLNEFMLENRSEHNELRDAVRANTEKLQGVATQLARLQGRVEAED